MLVIENQEHFDKVVAFAREKRLYDDNNQNPDTLARRLKYLEDYGGKNEDRGDRMRVRLMPDFAPMSFYFHIEKKADNGTWSTLFNGGLLYHGPHDGNGSGSAPTFAVTLGSVVGWSIHT